MPDETFYEDSSTALGLGHGARLGLKRVDFEHEAKLREAGIKTASDEQRVDPVNAGSADRIAELVTMGYGTAEAIDIALSEADGEEGAKERRDHMGDRTENLMRASVSPDKHGSRSSGKKRGRKVKPLMTAVDRAMVGTVEDEIPKNEVEWKRAERLAAENMRLAELREGLNRPGAPLKGKEPRMRIQGRLEPSVVLNLHKTTGLNCVEILEQVNDLLSLAKSGAQAQEIIHAVTELVNPREDVA